MTYTVKPMQIIEARDRALYIHDLVEKGDYVVVEFYDHEKHQRKVEGIFHGHPFTTGMRNFQYPDTSTIAVEVRASYKRQNVGGEFMWSGGSQDGIAVIATDKIASIENVDGPVAEPAEIDYDALSRAIRSALGAVDTVNLTDDIIHLYSVEATGNAVTDED